MFCAVWLLFFDVVQKFYAIHMCKSGTHDPLLRGELSPGPGPGLGLGLGQGQDLGLGQGRVLTLEVVAGWSLLFLLKCVVHVY